jgi:hypothetical protein
MNIVGGGCETYALASLSPRVADKAYSSELLNSASFLASLSLTLSETRLLEDALDDLDDLDRLDSMFRTRVAISSIFLLVFMAISSIFLFCLSN